MQTPLRHNEQLAKTGPANCQHEAETVGGQLFCTSQRLIFESQAFNIHQGTTLIELSHIVAAKAVATNAGGIFPMTPNSFEVQLRDGSSQTFVVMGRDDWLATVERLRGTA